MTEAWLRGAVPGFDPWIMPVVHALIQAREDAQQLLARMPTEQLWVRPGGAASVGFHVRHTARALDRLFTYARGEALSEAQRLALRDEQQPGDPPTPPEALLEELDVHVERALEQLRATISSDLLEERRVGRAGLPATTLGLLFHAAEHATRHIGQAVTTMKVLTSTAK